MKTRIAFVLCFFLVAFTRAGHAPEDMELVQERAEEGNAYYQSVLGEIYYQGEHGDADLKKAVYWFEQAAKAGAPLAYYYLGVMSRVGEYAATDSMNGKQFFAEAYSGLRELAVLGDARAQTALSAMYRYGWGTEKDSAQSLMWNKTAAEQGFPRAMYNQGIIYYKGMGVEKDYGQSRFWFEKLAAKGNEDARFQIANMYYNGHGYEKDVDKALSIFRELQTPNRTCEKQIEEGDYIIPGLLPPKYSLAIEEGSCGECCLWSVFQANGVDVTQIEINKAGGDPHRGLHFDELFIPALEYGVGYVELSTSVNTSDCELTAERYRSFLYEAVVDAVEKGNPVLIGVKVYPTRHPEWFCDHFILAVGYNEETDELICNDFEKRKRLRGEQLISLPETGYSFVNDWHYVLAIEFVNLGQN